MRDLQSGGEGEREGGERGRGAGGDRDRARLPSSPPWAAPTSESIEKPSLPVVRVAVGARREAVGRAESVADRMECGGREAGPAGPGNTDMAGTTVISPSVTVAGTSLQPAVMRVVQLHSSAA